MSTKRKAIYHYRGGSREEYNVYKLQYSCQFNIRTAYDMYMYELCKRVTLIKDEHVSEIIRRILGLVVMSCVFRHFK